MNQQNLNYLKDNLKYLGFGEKLYPELEKNIQQGFSEFKLNLLNEYGKDKLNTDLFFRKSDQSDMYFFNSYNAKLTNDSGSQSQSFYINRGNGFTLKEAYNLLDGRAVNKDLTNNEGQKYNAWVKLDFADKDQNGNCKMKQFHQNYGYDLEAVLSKFPIKELSDDKQKEMLIRSLERGNLQSAAFEKDGKQEKMFIEANPQFKTINVYDGNMKKVQKEAMSHERVDQLHAKGSKQEEKQDGKEIKEGKSERQNLKQSKSKSDTLLPKKSTSDNKGLRLS